MVSNGSVNTLTTPDCANGRTNDHAAKIKLARQHGIAHCLKAHSEEPAKRQVVEKAHDEE
jgi:hypothetical protein